MNIESSKFIMYLAMMDLFAFTQKICIIEEHNYNTLVNGAFCFVVLVGIRIKMSSFMSYVDITKTIVFEHNM